jgi:hypothetical protein
MITTDVPAASAATNTAAKEHLHLPTKSAAAERRQNKARGASPGWLEKRPSREAAKENSIPQIAFIHNDLVLLQERSEFILKRNSLMVFLLARNVGCHAIHCRFAYRKRSVT